MSKKGAGGGTRSSHSTRTVFAKRVAPHEGVGRRKGIFFEVANWLPQRASLEGLKLHLFARIKEEEKRTEKKEKEGDDCF